MLHLNYDVDQLNPAHWILEPYTRIILGLYILSYALTIRVFDNKKSV